ncbi:hypothetical protein WX98_21170 [Pseudomonas syringae pv. persicae]|nr:hypothetical protein WX98_21170 [Pseudomonas syringae pv. persicae]
MAVRRISKRQTLSCDHGLLLIRRQQRTVALVVFHTQAGQQILVRTQKRVLDLPLNLRRQEALLIKKPSAVLLRRRAVSQAIRCVVMVSAEHYRVGRRHEHHPRQSMIEP